MQNETIITWNDLFNDIVRLNKELDEAAALVERASLNLNIGMTGYAIIELDKALKILKETRTYDGTIKEAEN